MKSKYQAMNKQHPSPVSSKLAMLASLGDGSSGDTSPRSKMGATPKSRVDSKKVTRSGSQDYGNAVASFVVPYGINELAKDELDEERRLQLIHGDASPELSPVIRILLVDDSAMNSKMLSRSLHAALAPALISVVEKEDGRAGLDTLAAAAAAGEPFDLLLVDGEMPVLDGYGMVAELRKDGSDIPVIGVTGNALPDDISVSIIENDTCVVLYECAFALR